MYIQCVGSSPTGRTTFLFTIMSKIFLNEYKELDSSLRKALETKLFGTLGNYGYHKEVAFFGVDVRRRFKHDLIGLRAVGFDKQPSFPVYHEVIKALARRDIWYIPEYPIPICQRQLYRSLGGRNHRKACFRTDFLLGPHDILEVDDSTHDSYDIKSEDCARDQYIRQVYQMNTWRIKTMEDIPRVLYEVKYTKPGVPWYYDNNAALWCDAYPDEIRIVDQLCRDDSKEIDDLIYINPELLRVAGNQVTGLFTEPGPWGRWSGENEVLARIVELLTSLIGNRPVIKW